MKISVSAGYWSAGPPPGATDLFEAAERIGVDQIWTAEAYGSDAWTPLAWWGSRTSRIKLGTAVSQISARPPVTLAMTAMTLDHLTQGRVLLGVGTSNPQVVEGWYGAAVPPPAGAHPGVHRHPQEGHRAPGAGQLRRPALPAPAAGRHRAR